MLKSKLRIIDNVLYLQTRNLNYVVGEAVFNKVLNNSE